MIRHKRRAADTVTFAALLTPSSPLYEVLTAWCKQCSKAVCSILMFTFASPFSLRSMAVNKALSSRWQAAAFLGFNMRLAICSSRTVSTFVGLGPGMATRSSRSGKGGLNERGDLEI